MDSLLEKRIAISRNLHVRRTELCHVVGDLTFQGDVANSDVIEVDWIPYKAGVNHFGIDHENHMVGLDKPSKALSVFKDTESLRMIPFHL
jgi:hypothetical protein